MGPTLVLSAPDGLNIGPMNLAIRDGITITHLIQCGLFAYHRILDIDKFDLNPHVSMLSFPGWGFIQIFKPSDQPVHTIIHYTC